MWVFTELADAFDALRKEDDRILDEVFQGWVDYAVAHEDDPVWYSPLRNAAIYTGAGLLYSSWKLSSGVASGFLDVLRIGDGVKKGGWGYAQDALRLLVVAGPALRVGRLALSRLASIDAFPTQGICAWVAAAKALRMTGVKHFATVEDLAQAVGTTGSKFPSVPGVSVVAKIIEKLGGVVRPLTPTSTDVTTNLLAATEANPNGVIIFGVRWLMGNQWVGHALIALRHPVTGVLQILDRSGRVVSSLADLEALYPGIKSAALYGSDTMVAVLNATAVTVMDALSNVSLVLEAAQALDPDIPHEKTLIEQGVTHAFDVSGMVKHIGLEVRSVPFRAEKGRRVRVPVKPITKDEDRKIVSSTVCSDLGGLRLSLEGGPTGPVKNCVTTTYESKIYVVKPGDTLGKIAKQVYGTERLWPLIYEANQPAIGPDPNFILVGTRLDIVMTATRTTWQE